VENIAHQDPFALTDEEKEAICDHVRDDEG
jgi:hypothetical protein